MSVAVIIFRLLRGVSYYRVKFAESIKLNATLNISHIPAYSQRQNKSVGGSRQIILRDSGNVHLLFETPPSQHSFLLNEHLAKMNCNNGGLFHGHHTLTISPVEFCDIARCLKTIYHSRLG